MASGLLIVDLRFLPYYGSPNGRL